jgi:two-component system sensor histidine kinase KdpD
VPDRRFRLLAGAILAATGLAALTAVLVRLRDDLSLASVVLLYLVTVVATAVVGGLLPSLAAAVAADLLVNFYFVPPFHTFTVEHQNNVITLVVFVAVSATVSIAMDLAARQRAAVARTSQRLAAQAARARELAETDRLRAALLAAVGHDLRTPLAGLKAGTSSLRDPATVLTPAQEAELVTAIDESADRMVDLVENLLAMSRLHAGALSIHAQPVALDAVVATALLHQRGDGPPPVVDVADDLPLALADPGLLERVVANLVSNAQRASPAGACVQVTAARAGPGQLVLRIIDRGPGIPPSERPGMFTPFQGRSDRPTNGGLGLGLAIARGFTEAMGGTLTPSDTPGGGLTMTVMLPLASP